MGTKIDIKVLLIDDALIFNRTNNEILIKVVDPLDDTKIIYEESTTVTYELDNYLLLKRYFFYTKYYDYYPPPPPPDPNNPNPNPLETKNILIKFLNPNIIYNYDFNYNTVYIYFFNYDLPFQMLGIRNVNNSVTVSFKMNVITNIRNYSNYIKVSNVKNYTLQNQNTISIFGNIIQFIPTFEIQDTGNPAKFYKLYKLPPVFALTKLLKIYFFDLSYSKIENIPYYGTKDFTTNAIPVLVQLYDESNLKYQYIINLNFDVVNFDKYFYLVLYFKNIVDINYDSIVLRVFSYDFITYFITTVVTDYTFCEQITFDKNNLYNILIEKNTNIPTTQILNLNFDDYNINVDLIRLRELILFEVKNFDRVSNFFQSGNIEIKVLINFLYNYKIKDYNFVNVRFNEVILENNQFAKVNSFRFANFYKENYVINFNNIELNCMLLNIELLFFNEKRRTTRYNIYGMLLYNNNTWDIYTKKMLLTDENKYNLIKDLSIISNNYYQINIYAYNNIDDLNKNIKTSTLANTTMPNPFYKFNSITLNKNLTSVGFILDENDYLKFSLTLTCDYKVLMFQVPKSITDTILNFKTNHFIFKIFRINGSYTDQTLNITSNPNPNTNLYSILFSSISDCNYFMNYIQFGISTPPQKINSYFNIPKSKNFTKDSFGFYTITDSTTSDTIFLSVNNVNLVEGVTFINNSVVLAS